jgi:hypothetical protein
MWDSGQGSNGYYIQSGTIRYSSGSTYPFVEVRSPTTFSQAPPAVSGFTAIWAGSAETGKSWRYEKTSNPLTATETASASLSGSGGVYSGSVDGSTPVSGHSIPSLNTSEIMAEGQQSQTNVLCPWLYSYFTSVNQNVNNFPTSFSATNYTKSRTTSTASMEINCPTC